MTTDINTIRIASTVLAFVCFIGVVVWAYSKKRATTYEKMAALALHDDDWDTPKNSSSKELN